jgi:hypothetical protein
MLQDAAARVREPAPPVEPPKLAANGRRPPTILIALPLAISVRDVLRNDFFRILKASGARLVVMSPAHDRPEFVKEFGGDNVFFEPLHPYTPGTFERRLDSLRYSLFSDLTETIGLRSTPAEARPPLKRAAFAAARLATRTLGRRRTERALSRLNLTLFPDQQYTSVLDRYQPDLVCLTRVFFWSADYPVLKAAVARHIPTVLLVSSWDNLTSKGVFPARVDRLVVWNSILAEEAVALHGFTEDQTFVAGVPQFDIYADKSKLPDRASFFRRVGADPDKALITFALCNERLCPDEFAVVERLWKAMREGALGRPSQLLCRVHPQAAAFGRMFPDELRGLPDLLLDVPGRAGAHLDRDTSLDDMKHLAATMWHSDVLIQTSSTTAIDAAAMDTPVVSAAFDGYRTLPDDQSVRKYHLYTHYKKLLALGGVRVAHSLEQLVEILRGYLDDPSRDREGRARIVERQCLAIDGKAGERMAHYVLNMAAAGPRARG